MDRKKEMIQIINSMAGKYSSYEVFSDWIRCSALAISNSYVISLLWKQTDVKD